MQKPQLDGLLRWRNIGPHRGGRVVAVAGDVQNKQVFYFGAAAGGVFKTTDGGVYWQCVSDGFFKTGSVGALAVAESDPNVIYAGMGETTIRIDVSHGDGVYKSTDAGRTWQHMGLASTRHIAKLRIHPHNPDIVYAAAFGHAFGDHPDRGVYRSLDGGHTWDLVLHVSEKAGAIDLTMDPNNPRILYAATWEAYRTFWQISSGGPGSGVWRSTDGGTTWENLSEKTGMPKAPLGKIGVSASCQPGRVWALMEAQGSEAGLFRSDDYGENWTKVWRNDGDDGVELLGRPWYFTHITADPQHPDTVYVNNWDLYKSTDGGATWSEITTHHGDNHDIWLDPTDNQRMIQGNDGGAHCSFNGGATWTTVFNQPTAQFYHVAVDNAQPYNVYGTQQDNTSIRVPSRAERGAIGWSDSYPTGTGESGFIAPHPDDPNIVYVGAIGSSPGGGNALQRYDERTKQLRLITPWPETFYGGGAKAYKYRFAWTYPIVFDPHASNTLYITGNYVFKTTDEGQSWEVISPDLTRADPDTLKPTGGPVNYDDIGAETYATIFAFAVSPHEKGVFWAGSDDGLVHVSRDGGQKWTKVTPPDLPEFTLISMIEVSPHDAATAYLAATRYKLDDYTPYLYKTTDYGETWTRITNGIREDDFTRAIREDPNRKDLLYVGTETGIYLSFDGGVNWSDALQLNLPVCPVHDLVIKDRDLVVGTHGRSFWILDDLSPLYEYSEDITRTEAHLFQPRTTIRSRWNPFGAWLGGKPGKNYMPGFGATAAFTDEKTPENATLRRFFDAGENPPRGVIVTYFLQTKPEKPISLVVKDAEGNVVRRFTSLPEKPEDKEDDVLYLPAKPGMNRFVWDMHHEPSVKVTAKTSASSRVVGPVALPGTYTLTLTVGERDCTQSVELVPDPRVTTSHDDFKAQFELLLKTRDKISEANTVINQLTDLDAQLDGLKARLSDAAIKNAVDAFKERVKAVRDPLIAPEAKKKQDAINHGSRLVEQLAGLYPVVIISDDRPTDAAETFYEEMSGKIDEVLSQAHALFTEELPSFNHQMREAEVNALVLKAPAMPEKV